MRAILVQLRTKLTLMPVGESSADRHLEDHGVAGRPTGRPIPTGDDVRLDDTEGRMHHSPLDLLAAEGHLEHVHRDGVASSSFLERGLRHMCHRI